MNHFLTIYTPTYNRAKNLIKVYKSLCDQTEMDFIWLVIDDGSTDDTREVVSNWKKEEKIEIEYFYKQNGGVHTARDAAYRLVTTELITSVDSDDWVDNKFVEIIKHTWEKRTGEYAGIFSRNRTPDNQILGMDFPKVKSATYQEFTFKYGWKGDKHTIIRSDIIKTIQDAPIFEGENLVGETYKWIQLPEIPFILINDTISIVDYQESGYSKNARKNWFENLNGFRVEYRQHIADAHYIKPRIKGNIGYIMTSLYLHDMTFIRKSPRPIETFLLAPIGVGGYVYSLLKWKKYRK